MENIKLKLKKIYRDIVLGYSSFNYNNEKIYIKHLHDFDSIVLEEKSEYFSKLAADKGLPNEKERLEYLKKEEIWTEKQEQELKEQIDYLDSIKTSKTKTIIPSMIEGFNISIKETEEKIREIQNKKSELIGLTVEKYAAKQLDSFYLFTFSFKNSELNQNFFDQEIFDELESEDLLILHFVFSEFISLFNTLNLKRVALCSFFLNSFYLAENDASKFYGQPIYKLTLNQIELFHHGNYFKHILSENKDIKITDEMLENPDKLIETSDLRKNIEKELDRSENQTGEGGAVSIVGAKKEDLNKLGFTTGNLNEKFANAAKSKGRKLTMHEMLAIEEGQSI